MSSENRIKGEGIVQNYLNKITNHETGHIL